LAFHPVLPFQEPYSPAFPSMTYVFVDTHEKFGVDFNIKQSGEDNNEKIAKLLAKPREPIDSI